MAAMMSAILLAQRGIDDGSSLTAKTVSGRQALDEITADLRLATAVTEATATAVTFTVPDRTGDDVAETIRYAWSGTAGDPVTRTFNGVTVDFVDDVHQLDLTYLIRTIEAGADYSGTPGIAVDNLIICQGNAVIDSYNSSVAPYTSVDAGSSAVISTNAIASGSLSVTVNAVVHGDAYVGPSGNPNTAIYTSGNGEITGTTGTLDAEVPMPSPTAPSLGSSVGDVRYESGTTTLSSDLHCDKLEIRDAILKINGEVNIVCEDEFRIDGNGQIQIPTGSLLHLYAKDRVRIRDNALVNATNGDPSNFRLYSLSTGVDMEFEGNSKTHAIIQSPHVRLSMLDAQAYGTFLGYELALDGNAQFHVDLAEVNEIQFGLETPGSGSQDSVTSRIRCTQATLNKDATITEIVAYIRGPIGEAVRFGIYSDSGGEPGTKIVETELDKLTVSTAHWHTIDITPTDLSAGTYWLAISFSNTSMYYYYTSGGQTRHKYSDTPALPSSWGVSDFYPTWTFSIYGLGKAK